MSTPPHDGQPRSDTTSSAGAVPPAPDVRTSTATPSDDRDGARRRGPALLVAGAAAVGALVAAPIASVVTAQSLEAPAAAPATDTPDSTTPSVQPAADDGSMDTSAVAAAVTPSVVRIDVAGANGQGSGSGVIFDTDGTIVTNNHVIADARRLRVTTSDGTQLAAELVGTWPVADLAVLQVEADEVDLSPTEVASEPVQLGQPVVAVGSPFGLDGSVTSGIVSATGRTVTTGESALTNLVQTDAAINPGNSGGALVNADGQLVGINTVIATSGGGSDGIGFAIDASTVADVVADLVDDGEVTQPVLGVHGTSTVNPDGASGALVAQVVSGSAADEAGLREGDVITALDGDQVASFAELAGRIVRMDPGDEVALTVQRDDTTTTVTATLQQMQA